MIDQTGQKVVFSEFQIAGQYAYGTDVCGATDHPIKLPLGNDRPLWIELRQGGNTNGYEGETITFQERW